LVSKEEFLKKLKKYFFCNENCRTFTLLPNQYSMTKTQNDKICLNLTRDQLDTLLSALGNHSDFCNAKAKKVIKTISLVGAPDEAELKAYKRYQRWSDERLNTEELLAMASLAMTHSLLGIPSPM
jgi:thiamine kinase-like enzyme